MSSDIHRPPELPAWASWKHRGIFLPPDFHDRFEEIIALFERILSIHHPDWSCLLGILMAHRDVVNAHTDSDCIPPWLTHSPLGRKEGEILRKLVVQRRCSVSIHLGCAIFNVMFNSEQGEAQPANTIPQKRKNRSDRGVANARPR